MGYFDDLLNWLYSYFNSFLDSIYNIVYYIFSPFINLLISLMSFIQSVITDFTDLIHAIGGLFTNIISLITNTVGLFFPTPWVSLIIVGLGIVTILRAYHFFKDVEIAGFKI